MLKFICLFFPAVFSILVLEKINGKSLPVKQTIFLYLSNTIFINAFCLFIKRFILNTADNPLSAIGADMTPTVALNYLIIVIPFAIIVAIIEVLFNKTVKIKVEDTKNNEDEEKSQ